MSSNCYIVWDDVSMNAIVIDPASENSLKEIDFITKNNLKLEYILLTHEHTDHTWGVNALLDQYEVKVICSENCKLNLPKAGNSYFRLYYERKDYDYSVRKVDQTVESLNYLLIWNNYVIRFIPTPGHSIGSMCIDINGHLFTGDTLMQYKVYINKKNGNLNLYKNSIETIVDLYPKNTIIYPGHGDKFLLQDKDKILNIKSNRL